MSDRPGAVVVGTGFGCRVHVPALRAAQHVIPINTSALIDGFAAEEGRISIEDWRARCADGSLTEVFACGTAAVITPVGHVKSRTDDFSIRGGAFGPVASRLRETLLGIQHGTAPDPHGWLHRVV